MLCHAAIAHHLTRFSLRRLICPSCQSAAARDVARLRKSDASSAPSRPVSQGAYRDRHERWTRDAMDAVSPADEWRCRGRRSRVVLTPQWLASSRRSYPPVTVSKKPDRRGARRKPLKPFVQGMPDCFWHACGDYARMLPSFRIRGCGCGQAPGIPCALVFGRSDLQRPGRFRAAGSVEVWLMIFTPSNSMSSRTSERLRARSETHNHRTMF
jgi:hypothetical protein